MLTQNPLFLFKYILLFQFENKTKKSSFFQFFVLLSYLFIENTSYFCFNDEVLSKYFCSVEYLCGVVVVCWRWADVYHRNYTVFFSFHILYIQFLFHFIVAMYFLYFHLLIEVSVNQLHMHRRLVDVNH